MMHHLEATTRHRPLDLSAFEERVQEWKKNELPRRKQRGIKGNIINFSPQAAGNLTRRD